MDSADALLAQYHALQKRGGVVGTVVVAASVDIATQVFETLAAERGNAATALVYFPPADFSGAEAERLQQIEGVSCVPAGASARVLHNAIHASSRQGPESAQIIDIAEVMRAKRQSLRILVAEDNSTNQVIICKVLEQAGHTVFLAEDGERALDLYQSEEPDFAIFDDNMPERTGQEVAAAIRTMELPGVRIPIIILSATTTLEARETARRCGADEFVGKPFDATQLLDTVDRLARRANRDQRPAARSRAVPQTASGPLANALPLLDLRKVAEVERIGRDLLFFAQFVAVFRGDVERLLGRFDVAFRKRDLGELLEVEHGIRGAALGIGAMRVAGYCSAVERAVANGDINSLEVIALGLRSSAEQTFAQLDARLAIRKHSQVSDSSS